MYNIFVTNIASVVQYISVVDHIKSFTDITSTQTDIQLWQWHISGATSEINQNPRTRINSTQ